MPIFVSKGLLEHDHVHLFTLSMEVFVVMLQKLSSLYGPQNLKYLLSGTFKKNFAEPCSRGLMSIWEEKSAPLDQSEQVV